MKHRRPIVMGIAVAAMLTAGYMLQSMQIPVTQKDKVKSIAVSPSKGTEPKPKIVNSEGSYALDKSWEELMQGVPAEDRALAEKALKENQDLYIYSYGDERGNVVVKAGDKRLHPDPAADRDFIDGKKDKPDPMADKEYWQQNPWNAESTATNGGQQ